MRNHRGPQSVGLCVRGGASLLGVCFALGVLALASTGRAAQITDDFNDQNDTANPAWSHYAPLGGTYSFPGGNTYRLQAPTSPSPGTVGPGRVASYLNNSNFSTFSISIDVVDWDNTGTPNDQDFGLLARLNSVGPATTTGYALTYSPTGHTMDLSRITGEQPTGLGNAPLTLDPSKDYRLVFTGVGNTFTGTVYDLADLATPLQTLTRTDPNNTYTNGFPGLLVFDNSGTHTGDATFDNFSATDTIAPEPAGAAVCGVLALGGLIRRRRRCC
jgi:hypothetical protein